MKLFRKLNDDAQVIVKANGVFKQCATFARGTDLFVQHSGGYLRMISGGTTSRPGIIVVDTPFAADEITEEPWSPIKLTDLGLDRYGQE